MPTNDSVASKELRADLFERIAAAPRMVIETLVDNIPIVPDAIEIIRAPRPGRIMMRLAEGITGRPFNLGEVLVSEAEVRVAGEAAYMMMVGDEPERAFLGAVLLGAYRRYPELRLAIDVELDRDAARQDKEQRALWSAVAQSRVDFEGGAIEAYSPSDRTKGRGS
jgi:alpha-D-ribose 1-methylphosphonate 5-triphosphate synthase subunit PhnG